MNSIFLGIDYGTKRVGIAISDDSGRVAFPQRVVPNTPVLAETIAFFVDELKVGAVVVGESYDLSGRENPVQKDIIQFVQALEKRTGLPVYFEREYWTSQEARRTQGMTDMNDASAAALILQRYLDKHSLRNMPDQDEE